MTNNDILKADLLDIIFDNRNKDYGAYALRRQYPQRMLLSLSAIAAILLTIILLNATSKETVTNLPTVENKLGFQLKPIELPPVEQPRQPEQRVRQKPVKPVASIKHTNKVNIKPDKLVKTTVPPITEFDGRQVATTTTDGEPKTDIVKPTEPVTDQTGNGENKVVMNEFRPEERQPEFPGGMAAMMRFLKNNLVTPDELQAGERKTVMIKFRVETDGAVGSFEIMQSAGSTFDREVIRVCKKMPRWSPAFQNGVNVAMQFILPVSFIGVEEGW